MIPKPDFCSQCPINHVTSQEPGEGYVPALIPADATELWVGEAAGDNEAQRGLPFIGGAGAWLDSLCRAGKIDRTKVGIVNTIGCRPPGNIYPSDIKWHATSRQAAREGIAYCAQHHLRPALERRNWSRIVALGDKALEAVTDKRGVLIWRGSALPLKGTQQPRVMPTLHPAYLMRQAGLFPVVVNDLKRNLLLPPEHYNLYASEVQHHVGKLLSFDFEWDWSYNITLCGLTSSLFGCDVYSWTGENIPGLRSVFEQAPGFIGHNIIGADISHIERLGWNIDWNKVELWDTMLMQHLVQPDYRHGLGFVASVWTKKVFWKGAGEESEDEDGNIVDTKVQWKTWDHPNAIPRQYGGYGGCKSADEAFRLYNARDTDAAFQASIPLRRKLEEYGLLDVYQHVSVPVAFVCRDIAEYGIRLDHSRLKEIRTIIDSKLDTLDRTLPDGLRSYDVEVMKNEKAPPNTWKQKAVTCKGGKKYGGTHEPRTYIFQSPTQCHQCDCGKVLVPGKMSLLKTIKVPARERVVPWNSTQKVIQYANGLGLKSIINRKTGRVAGDKNARKQWGRQHSEFAIVDQLKKNVTLRNSFAKDALFGVERMYFNLLVHGTAEGRLSSSGKREGIDLNIQNQPKEIRRIFVPDEPGWGILNPDWKGAENLITAYLAKDFDRLKRLAEPGYSEHLDYAQRLFGPGTKKSLVGEDGTKFDNPLYTTAKRINHGTNYGMGVKKMQEVLAVEGFNYTESDIKEFKRVWRIMNAGTARWQDEVTALAGKQSFLRNVFGRCRYFQSRDYATKALAFLPASTLADICLRCMIALNLDLPRCAQAASALGIAVTYQLPRPWRLMCQVHDSLPAQGPQENYMEVARGMKAVMEQPWAELDGFSLAVDFGYSTSSWGECKDIEVVA